MTNKLTLHERREQVHDLLNPDEIRRHRIAEGMEVTNEQAQDIAEKGKAAALFARKVSSLSNAALALDALDPESRLTRSLLGTEPLFQAMKRGEIEPTALPEAAITKVDLIMTPHGFSIVEIEPGKVRGLGYGRMVREQATAPVGLGSEQGLAPIAGGRDTMIALSDHDRFHIPELNILGRFVGGLCVVNQAELLGSSAPQAILASPLKGDTGAHIEEMLRRNTVIVSDRRLDLESKGALALVHNADENPRIEDRLLSVFSKEELELLRTIAPKTHHTLLMTHDQRQKLRENVIQGKVELFAKPMADSGTRRMITPDNITALADLLIQKQVKAFVLQEAAAIVPQRMESIDVLTAEHGVHDMNTRVTIHVDSEGNIIEASVVGSPHEHLAHGGKTSVITNLELAS